MIARILALVALVSVASGGAWYVFRDTPQKRIARWREEARYFLEKTADLEKAEELNDKILQIIPTSAHDLVFKATIKERRGTQQALRDALEIYDKVLSTGDTNVLVVAFLQARTCCSMGLITQAQGTLLSVVDVFPFEAMMELGETSLVAFAGADAVHHFTKARDVAESKTDVARAQEGIANAYLLLLSLGTASTPIGGLPDEISVKSKGDPAKILENLRSSAKQALNDALSFVKSDDAPASTEEANRRLVWATTLFEKLASVKSSGDTPRIDGIVLVEGRRNDYSIRNKESPELLVRLGALRLMAVRDEAPKLEGRIEIFERDAEKDFMQALQASPEEAKAFLTVPVEPTPGAEDKGGAARTEDSAAASTTDLADEYLQKLMTISRVYLATAHFKRLLDDGTQLALSRRIGDVIESGSPGASSAFAMLTAFARFRSGEVAEGEKLTEAYLSSLPADAKPRATIDLAEYALRFLPDAPLSLKLFDRFDDAGGKPLDLIGKRVSLLIAARANAALSSEASRRLEEVLRRATEVLEGPGEYLGVAKIFYALKGRDAAVGIIRAAAARYPEDRSIRRLLADLHFEKAGEARTPPSERLPAYREALGGYLKLFIQGPGESQDVGRRAVEAMKKIEEEHGELDLAQQLKPLFRSASDAAMETFASAIRGFFLAQFGPALDRATAISQSQSFNPFLSFMRGSCHVGLATYLLRDSSRASSDVAKQSLNTQYKEHVQKAMEEFRLEPGFEPSKLELANLELQQIPPGEDVPDDLLETIQRLSNSKELEHSGHFLLARALRKRFEHRYADKSVKSSELVRIVLKEQNALRNAIRKKPTFVPAYLALAETFLLADRPEKEKAGTLSRQIFTPSYEKAISIVKAVPSQDEQVISRLAQYSEALGHVDDAVHYLEQVASARPSPDVFSRLFANYLRKDNPSLRVFLEHEPPAPKGRMAEGELKDRLPFLLSLRSNFEQLPEGQGLRYMFLAMEAEKAEAQSTNDTARSKHHAEMVAAYTKSIESFDAKGITVPLVVLNNLAWYLSEDMDLDRKARGLGLAVRGKEQAPNPVDAPDVHDTYGWALYQSGKLVESEQALRELIKAVDEPTYRYHLACVLFALKKLDDALAEVRRAIGSTRPFKQNLAARELESEIKEARRKAVGE